MGSLLRAFRTLLLLWYLSNMIVLNHVSISSCVHLVMCPSRHVRETETRSQSFCPRLHCKKECRGACQHYKFARRRVRCRSWQGRSSRMAGRGGPYIANGCNGISVDMDSRMSHLSPSYTSTLPPWYPPNTKSLFPYSAAEHLTHG